MRRSPLLFASALAALLLGLLLAQPSPAACQDEEVCPQPAATGRQGYPTELAPVFEQAGMNRLPTERAPVMPTLLVGYPTVQPRGKPYVPCILLKAVGQTESQGWKQFRADYGQKGETVISRDYGYGIMQITSGMSDCTTTPEAYDRGLVAASSVYNIATGALFLADKWNHSPSMGSNDPYVVEDWYYATWAYNGFSYDNNPNHPDYDEFRPPFTGDEDYWDYPYQEIVWGWAAHPPALEGKQPAWEAQALSLPDRMLITNPPPKYLPRPAVWHTSCLEYRTLLPNLAQPGRQAAVAGPGLPATPTPPALTATVSPTPTATEPQPFRP